MQIDARGKQPMLGPMHRPARSVPARAGLSIFESLVALGISILITLIVVPVGLKRLKIQQGVDQEALEMPKSPAEIIPAPLEKPRNPSLPESLKKLFLDVEGSETPPPDASPKKG